MTAVLPLQKQSRVGWERRSLSMALYARAKAFLHAAAVMSSPALEARTADMSFSGSASRTLRATRWPCGPCPSNTPHSTTSSSPPNPCTGDSSTTITTENRGPPKSIDSGE